MKQEINLYQERFRPRRLWLSARQLLALTVALLVVLSAVSVHLVRERMDARRQVASVQQEQQALQQDVATLKKKLDALLADTRWKRREEHLERQLRDYRKILGFVSGQRFGSGEGFSRPLAALAGLSVGSVWLEQILLSERDIKLQGAAMKAESVPEYFAQLRREKVFAEHSFELFRIHRSPRYDWKLEFTVSTQEEPHE